MDKGEWEHLVILGNDLKILQRLLCTGESDIWAAHLGGAQFLLSPRFGSNSRLTLMGATEWLPSWASALHHMMPDLGLRRPRMLNGL